jgi:DNA-binding Lrp family transcriptional regulator
MVTVFILVNSKAGTENQVFEQLKEIPEIEDAYQVYGVYDAIVKAQAENMHALKDIISLKIRRIENVESTLTMVAT